MNPVDILLIVNNEVGACLLFEARRRLGNDELTWVEYSDAYRRAIIEFDATSGPEGTEDVVRVFDRAIEILRNE